MNDNFFFFYSDDPSLWLKRFISGTMDRIITARVLPFKTGITFTIRGIGNIHLLLFDIRRTDSLLLFFATGVFLLHIFFFKCLSYEFSYRKRPS